ncbi:hypothetical protein WJX84_007606 [Apatococcus fuscideae]|uniref:Uncharacterized protein n=1 Tax=Apatococcus fuscideae TaxID=2026836 RepID=A0AAW1SZZ5_9CHLO
MHYISQEDGRTCLEGPVEQRFDAEIAPNLAGKLDEDYIKKVQARTAATAKQKTMKFLEDKDAAASKVRGAENKRERADKDTLEQVLFNLFEAQGLKQVWVCDPLMACP